MNLGLDTATVDPSRFNDPLALKIDWSPAKKGGTNFQTRKLVNIAPYRVEFRPTKFALFFYMAFAFGGVGVVFFFFFSRYLSHQLTPDINILIPLLIALVITTIGCFLLYFGTTPIIFDKMKSAFWKGRKSPEQVLDPKTLKDFVRMDDIYALQLVSEYIRAKNSYYSYELNIVRKDGSRVNVVDHGSKEKLKQDAQTLSRFLGKPLWDAI